MQILLYILSAIVALLIGGIWWCARRWQAQHPDCSIFDDFFRAPRLNDGLGGGDYAKPNDEGPGSPHEAFLVGLPQGMHAGQQDVGVDADQDVRGQLIDALASAYRRQIANENPIPPKPKHESEADWPSVSAWWQQQREIQERCEQLLSAKLAPLVSFSEPELAAALADLEKPRTP